MLHVVHPPLQTFTVEVTEDFLEYLETGVLAVEVWGHRRSGFIETGLVSGPDDAVEGRRPKSFLERCINISQSRVVCFSLLLCIMDIHVGTHT